MQHDHKLKNDLSIAYLLEAKRERENKAIQVDFTNLLENCLGL